MLIDFDAIKAAAPMRTVLEHYGIDVDRRGLAVCPFHDDRQPSMKVYADGFYCFSCGAGGDAVTFVARKEGVRNTEAARILSIIGGLTLTDDFRTREKLRKAAQEKRQRQHEREAMEARYDALCAERRALCETMRREEPFGDLWCIAANRLPSIEGELDGIFEAMG